jgi:hypothetical protein
MLDGRRISFEVAYRISGLKHDDAKTLVGLMASILHNKLDEEKMRLLTEMSRGSEKTLTKKEILKVISKSPSE